MPAPFDQLQAMSFAGAQFPYETYSITGGIRKHKHEYPHNPGAAVEKLGRELYEIHVSVKFTAGLAKAPYDDLLLTLAVLRDAFEQQLTDALVIPHIGTIQACAEKWTEGARNTNRSTISGDFTFFEDLNSAVALADSVTVSSAALPALLDKFNIAREGIVPDPVRSQFKIPATGPNATNIFDAINDLTVSICGIKDQADLFGALVASKIDGLLALYRAADTQISQLNQPKNHEMLEAMHAMWLATLELQRDLQNTGYRAQIFVTPARMSITQVSIAIYGTSAYGGQLLQLNSLDDPLSIPAYTQLVYYKALAQAAA